MKKSTSKEKKIEMQDEYDFSRGVRGKYASRYAKGSNVVVLDPDVVKVFHDSQSVNSALRGLVEIIHTQTKQSTAKK